MLDLLVAVVCLIAGFIGGCWLRRQATSDFQRGVQLMLDQMPVLIKSALPTPSVQHPRHEHNLPKQNGPPDKK